MTGESINQNIQRLCHFLNMDKKLWRTYAIDDGNLSYEPIYLLREYGRILDIYGAPKDGLSRLFLSAEDYREMEEWLARSTHQVIYQHDKKDTFDNAGQILKINQAAQLGFLLDGYFWHIQRIENAIS